MSRSFALPSLLLCGTISIFGVRGNAQSANAGQLNAADSLATYSAPVISSLAASASATTLLVTWQTVTPSSSNLQCGLANGSWTLNAVNNGLQTSVTNHRSIIAGLSPLTRYYCQAQSTGSDGQTASSILTATTLSLPPSTPIVGMSLGSFTPYNAGGHQMSGDTYNNCVSDDGFEYVTLNDTNGFDLASGSGANQMLGKFTSESPLIGANVNWLPAYGAARAQMGSDYSTAKSSGLYCLRGSIYMITQRVGAFNGSGGVKHISAQIIKSQDHGRTWNNFQSPNVYNSNGIMTNPADATSFASTTLFGASTFVMYGVDDYTLGYRVDNADAYVYIMGNDGYWNNGNNLYLARIPRSKLTNLNPADIQYYRGGDGIYDSAWSSSIQATQAVLSSAGKLSQPAVQYVPALNRYILFEWYYPNSIQASQANSAYTQWITYEAPHPWGPWRLIDNRSWLKEGYYGPVPLQRSALNGTTMKVLTTGNYNANWSGYPNLLTSFSYQIFSSTIQLQTGSTVSAPY